MTTLRKPEEIYGELLDSIESATDDELVSLLNEKCDMTAVNLPQDRAWNLIDRIPENSENYLTSLAYYVELGDRYDNTLMLLARLAANRHHKAFDLVKES